jgi:hypothetical protein
MNFLILYIIRGVRVMPTEEELLKVEILSASLVAIAAIIVVIATFQLLTLKIRESRERPDESENRNGSQQDEVDEGRAEDAGIEIRRAISRVLTVAALIAAAGESVGAGLANYRLRQLQAERDAGETDDPIDPSVKITVGGSLAALGSILIFQGVIEEPEETPRRIVVF